MESQERAVEIAARWPDARYFAMEVRPVMYDAGRRHLTAPGTTEDLLRQLAPQVLGTLVRRYGGFAECEDAVQEALLAAAVQWPAEGVPASPRSWLVSVAARRLIDQWRSDDARRNREVIAAHDLPAVAPAADEADAAAHDDTLSLLFLCCQPR